MRKRSRSSKALMIILITGGSFLFSSCAANVLLGNPSLSLATTPDSNEMLLIGCVIPEHPNSWQNQSLIVVIAYTPLGDSQKNPEYILVLTDSLGYFAVANISPGEYWLDRVQSVETSTYFWQRYFIGGKDKWGKENEPSTVHSFRPDTALRLEKGASADFGYLILSYKPADKYVITFDVLTQLQGQSFGAGVTYHRPPVPEYFIQRYPESEWCKVLAGLLPKNED